MTRTPYHKLAAERQRLRTPVENAIAKFLNGHGRARRQVAEHFVKLGLLPDRGAQNGVTWPDITKFIECRVVINDSMTAKFRLYPSNGGEHRLKTECPSCATWIPVGRFAQHCGSSVCRSTR